MNAGSVTVKVLPEVAAEEFAQAGEAAADVFWAAFKRRVTENMNGASD